MRKTVSITVSGQLFHVEEQAYRKLDEYLDAIRYHFSTYEDSEEIVSDIEGRVAEHFLEKLTKARNVVSEKDVDDLIAHMGTVKDFEAFESDAPAHDAEPVPEGKSYNPPKRLYRDADNQMIAGVAAGIAGYFGIDPTIIRLLFVASLIFGGSGIIVYIVLWLVMPQAKTTSERMEMRGQPLTLKRIEASIRENIPAAKDRIKPGTLSRIVQFPFTLLRQILRFVGRVLRAIVPILGRIIGFFIAAWAIIAIFALTFAAIMFSSGAWEPYMDVPLRELAGNLVYYMLIASGFMAALIPGIFVLFVGVSLLLLRNVFRFPIVISMLALWVVSLMLGAVTLGTEGPVLAEKIDQYVDSYEVASQRNFETGSFTSVSAHGNYDVRIRSGEEASINVTGTRSAVEDVRVSVENGTLNIHRESRHRWCIICLGNAAVVDVTMTGSSLESVEAHADAAIDMEGIDLAGGQIVSSAGSHMSVRGGNVSGAFQMEAHGGSRVDFQAQGELSELVMDVSAGSSIAFEGIAESADLSVQAGSSVTLRGTGSVLKASVVAGSNLDASQFAVREAGIDAAAGGWASVSASDRLSGSVHAGGEIIYAGDPEIDVDDDVSGHLTPAKSEELNYEDEYQDPSDDEFNEE